MAERSRDISPDSNVGCWYADLTKLAGKPLWFVANLNLKYRSQIVNSSLAIPQSDTGPALFQGLGRFSPASTEWQLPVCTRRYLR